MASSFADAAAPVAERLLHRFVRVTGPDLCAVVLQADFSCQGVLRSDEATAVVEVVADTTVAHMGMGSQWRPSA